MFELDFKYSNEFIKDDKLVEELNKLKDKYPLSKDEINTVINKVESLLNELGEYVRFSKIQDVLEETELFKTELKNITPKLMLDMLTQYIYVGNIPDITQNFFDEMVNECINSNSREKAWRLALNFIKNKNIQKIEDYFIEVRDEYYIGELLSTLYDDDLTLVDRVINKMVNTNDKKFIKKYLQLNYIDNFMKDEHYKKLNDVLGKE